MTEPIKVEGLAEFTRNLKKIDKELPKALRIAFNIAADIVVDYAKPRIPTRSGKARRSVKARSTQTAVRVQGGSKRVPYYPWLDFGGSVPAWGGPGMVRRPFKKDGRYIYKGYFKKSASGEFQEALEKALLDTAREAGVVID